MYSSDLIRLSGRASLASGVCVIIASLVILTGVFGISVPEDVATFLILVARILAVFAFLGVYAIQYKESGQAGMLGFALSLIGSMLVLSGAFSPLGLAVLAIGLLVLAAATRRAGVFPDSGLWLWSAGLVVGFAGIFASIPFDAAFVDTIIALSFAISGIGRLVLWRQLRSAAEEMKIRGAR